MLHIYLKMPAPIDRFELRTIRLWILVTIYQADRSTAERYVPTASDSRSVERRSGGPAGGTCVFYPSRLSPLRIDTSVARSTSGPGFCTCSHKRSFNSRVLIPARDPMPSNSAPVSPWSSQCFKALRGADVHVLKRVHLG